MPRLSPRSLWHLSLSLAALGLSACGGGGLVGAAPPPPPPAPLTVSARPAADATLSSGGGVNLGGPTLLVGEAANEEYLRAVLRFDPVFVPRGVTILSARLVLNQVSALTDPYYDVGPLHVDRVDLGLALDADDFDSPALAGSVGLLGVTGADGRFEPFGPLSGNVPLGSAFVDVSAAFQAAYAAGNDTFDLRLRMTLPFGSDTDLDFAVFSSAEAAMLQPQLVVEYRP